MRHAYTGARRALGVTIALSVTALLLVAGGSAAQDPAAAAEADETVASHWTPSGLRDGKTTVVVQLAGDPVAAVEGATAGELTKAEERAIQSRLEADQNSIRDDIARLGGQVLADYQSAYNGLKVRIDRDKAGALAALPSVTGVHGLERMTFDNTKGVALIGAPAVWDGLAGLHGEGIKVGIIDTGIDYTHANFNGPGTVAAYNAANAADTLPPAVGSFDPARFKGGIDLVGDDYNADPDDPAFQPIPHPDPNPLDCNGHGSHVAGSAAGSGVLADGTTYTGAYNATTISGNSWRIGPGVAPKAELYGIRVFGCEGSTDVVVDAIEWAVENDMDVINMSLGSSFGTKDDPSAVASTNAAKAGVIVVTSTGNSGPNQYIAGSPGSAEGAIATAANDSSPGFPGATISLSNGVSMTAINANEHPLASTLNLTVKVIVDDPATTVDPDGSAGTRSADESLGCDVQSFGGPLPPNTIAVVNRGTCARVAKAIFGQQAGAAAVVMVNNSTALPPLEGPITSNPDDGTPFTVTIPFLGVRGLPDTATSDGGKLRAANGLGAVVAAALIPNPNFTGFASFSSGGPRNGDSGLKPDITAPGVSIVSTSNGNGNTAVTISGTSMASPHTAGVAALTRQAHPDWKVADIKAAIVNTGNPAGVLGYRTSRGGTGLVQPAGSTKTQVVAQADDEKWEVALNYGFEELKRDFSDGEKIELRNNGAAPVTFAVSQTNAAGSPHTIELSTTSITVPAGGEAEVRVTLNVPAATAGASNGAGLSFQEVAGLITFTPTAGQNADVALRVPYYLVPRALSDVDTKLKKLKKGQTTTTATITNRRGVIGGDADFYAWGLKDNRNRGAGTADVRAIGIQSFPNPSATDPNRRLLVFAVNTHSRWSSPSVNEFDIFLDVDNDGVDDYVVVGVDDGLVRTGSRTGIFGSFVFSTRTGRASVIGTTSAVAPTDSSTALLFLRTSQLCLGDNPATPAADPEPCLNSATQPRFTYHAVGFNLQTDAVDEVTGSAKFNAWTSAISQGGFHTVAPGASATEPVTINAAEWALTPALGLMVVSVDNASGKDEAELLSVFGGGGDDDDDDDDD